MGSSFTQFALPLLVFKLTGSALNLGIAFAVSYLPYLLFGLVIGAWVDRLDRKRVMILADLGQAIAVAALPVAFLLGTLNVGWIYAVAFLSTTLHIFTDSSQFAAIPSLVDQRDLVTANGRFQASFFGATILGPVLAGALIYVIPVATLLFIDAASFLVSALMLSLIATSFNNQGQSGEDSPRSARTSIRQDILEGLRYLFGHPLLRSILIMIPLLNLFSATRDAQLVVLAEGHLHATDAQFGLLNAAGGAGVVIFSLLAGPLRKRGGYIRLALVAGTLGSLATIALALSPTIWSAIPLWALVFGTDYLFNIYSNTLRQEILPNEMLGRARSVAAVVSYTVLPPARCWAARLSTPLGMSCWSMPALGWRYCSSSRSFPSKYLLRPSNCGWGNMPVRRTQYQRRLWQERQASRKAEWCSRRPGRLPVRLEPGTERSTAGEQRARKRAGPWAGR